MTNATLALSNVNGDIIVSKNEFINGIRDTTWIP